jgi:general secretion pathway protein K
MRTRSITKANNKRGPGDWGLENGASDAQSALPSPQSLASRRGSALLAVLWVSAALAAIGFSLATMVRGETDRTSNSIDGLRAYYLAAGSVQRAAWELLWSVQNPSKRLIPDGSTHIYYTYPSGQARVELIPETAKLNVNTSPPDELYRLGVALGIEPERAREIAMAIVDWRGPPSQAGSFDEFYASLTPSFRARHASFEEIEELLVVKGVTPDIFYGTYVPADEVGLGIPVSSGPALVGRQGLLDCLSVYGSREAVDANTAAPAVLAAVGLAPDVVSALVERRRVKPFTAGTLNDFLLAYGVSGARLRLQGNSIVTMRATARLRLPNSQLSDVRRTVAAQVKYMPAGYDAPIHILRWYDAAWSF